MNNLQHIIKRDTRAAMHMAVELCEQGDFDSVADAFGWLLQERDDATIGGGECENLIDNWSVHDSTQPDFECSECHATGHADGTVTGGEYLFCPRCGAKVREAVER